MTEHTINALCERSHEISKSKGWLDKPRSFAAVVGLLHSELSEALEDYRNNKGLNETYYENNKENPLRQTAESLKKLTQEARMEHGIKPCGIPIELADEVIRICQYVGTAGWAKELESRYLFLKQETKWFDRYTLDFEEFIAMCHSRVSRAHSIFDDIDSPNGMRREETTALIPPLADLLDLIFSFSRRNNIDLWAAIDEKEAYNRTRPTRHGGKKI